MRFKVVILSARSSNLVPCIQSVLANEPSLSSEDIIVVDDGARAEAEQQLPPVRWVQGIKPFVFARNANLGIREASTDVILLNDDARLLTPEGFTMMSQFIRGRQEVGLCSAGIQGTVGNPKQVSSGKGQFRFTRQRLAFVGVYIPKSIYDLIGPLDERFVGYGFEDDDYCNRVLAAGYQLGIWEGCELDHSGELPSTFRTRYDLPLLFKQNLKLYKDKWGRSRESATSSKSGWLTGTIPEQCVDLLYMASNRLEFTRETFSTLLANTDWRYVHQMLIYDNGSKDGTREWLEANLHRAIVPTRLVTLRFGSPVAAMAHFIQSTSAPILAKTSNEAMMPPAWLGQSLEVLHRHPELSVLGIEPMNPHSSDTDVPRSYTVANTPTKSISGLGLYRRGAFAGVPRESSTLNDGKASSATSPGAGLIRGWITPALPVFLLERLPFEPWAAHSERYIKSGWQQPGPKYEPECAIWHWRWPQHTAATESVRGKLTRSAAVETRP